MTLSGAILLALYHTTTPETTMEDIVFRSPAVSRSQVATPIVDEMPRFTRWSRLDVRPTLDMARQFCWLDRETGRLIFSDSESIPVR